MEIKTKRLRLEPCTRKMLKGLIDENFFEVTEQRISENWPLDEIKDALPLFLSWIETGYAPLGWGMWLMISSEENIVIGGAGFIGVADESGAVEIGYSIAPEFRQQGFTEEACKALIQWAFSRNVKTINAKCEKSNIASIKLLEKLEMKRIKSEEELIYELKNEVFMKSEIMNKEEELRLAMINSDVEILNELIDDSLIFIGPNGLAATKSIDLEAHRSKIQKMKELTPSEQNIQLHDNFAVVSVKMQMVGTFGDTDISGAYRYLRIWTKINDSWKVVAGSVTKI